MRPRLLAPALAAAGALMIPSPSHAQNDDLNKLLAQLKSGRFADQGAAVRTVLYQRRMVVETLIEFVKDHAGNKKNYEVILQTREAMGLLGKLRATEAVPVLVENLTFSGQPPGPGVGPLPSLEGNRPAVAALIRIGVKSLGPVVERVASSEEMFVEGCEIGRASCRERV